MQKLSELFIIIEERTMRSFGRITKEERIEELALNHREKKIVWMR